MKKIILNSTIAFIIIMACSVNVSAQSDKPYTDGPLWEVQFVHTKSGMSDQYLKNHAALDGMREKMDAIGKKLFGTDDTQHNQAVSKNDLRVLQGGKITQELEFK